MNKKGQSTVEMSILMPLLVMVLGACMVVVYSSWQGIKVQQAANLAARVQGQERVAGGTALTAIDLENGTNNGGDDDPTGKNVDPDIEFTGKVKTPQSDSVYSRYYKLVKAMFPSSKQSEVFVPVPEIGQNVDRVKVVRVITLPKVPFMDGEWKNPQLKLEGKAWGGEDTFMYALPRWGKTNKFFGTVSPTDPAWKKMVQDSANSANSTNHD